MALPACKQAETETTEQTEIQTHQLSQGNLERVISATGTLKAADSKDISWETAGRVGNIFVSLDQIVDMNSLLAEIDEMTYSRELILAQSELISAERNLEDLLDTDLVEAQARAEIVNAQDALDEAREARSELDYQQISQPIIDGLIAELQLAKNELENAEQFFSVVEDRPADDQTRASALISLSYARKRRDNAQYNLDYALSFPNSDGVAEADANILIAEARLADAEREWQRIKNGPDINEVAAAELRLEAARKAASRNRLQAPIIGKITQIHNQVGDRVIPGDKAFRIDDCSSFLVEVPISEVDIPFIELGQKAEVRFDAVEGKSFFGEVSEVSKVGNQNMNYVEYDIIIEVPEGTGEIYSGMTAVVEILTDSRENVIRIPNKTVRKVNERTVVVVLEAEETRLVEVILGLNTGMYSELISGNLSEGDVLVSNPSISMLK